MYSILILWSRTEKLNVNETEKALQMEKPDFVQQLLELLVKEV